LANRHLIITIIIIIIITIIIIIIIIIIIRGGVAALRGVSLGLGGLTRPSKHHTLVGRIAQPPSFNCTHTSSFLLVFL
jgi:hypothetical protein